MLKTFISHSSVKQPKRAPLIESLSRAPASAIAQALRSLAHHIHT
jgi:hypothetical protein